MELIKQKIINILVKYRVTNALYLLYAECKHNRDQKKRYELSSQEKFKVIKNIKKGKRCFIIGNGPSLTVTDLNRLKKEDTFAVNRMYKIFDQTEWRPTFYCSQDSKVLEEVYEDLSPLFDICECVFLNSSIRLSNSKLEKDNLFYLFVNLQDYIGTLPEFSNDICKGIYEGYTVTYACIQLAVYMGYSEIYLMGIDHNYNFTICKDGTVKQDKSAANYMKGIEGDMPYAPQLEKTTLAYRKARIVCDENGVIIKNATRGGKLEEFERINFEELF